MNTIIKKLFSSCTSVAIASTLSLSAFAVSPTTLIKNNEYQSIACEFNKDVALKKTTRYSMLGDEEFDTAVCGYLITKEQEIFGEKVTTAYLRITNFADPGFKKSIEQTIAEGNTVNSIQDGNYDFNLGCLADGAIIGIEYEQGKEYIPQNVQEKIIQSSPEKPLAVVLSFGKHLGGSDICINLAHQVRLYE